MDVSGQDATPLVKDSDNADHLCDQCSESGQVVTASAFCRTCSDYLCRECIAQHQKLRALKDHEILEGSNIPARKSRSSCSEHCLVHPERRIEMFCPDDNIFGCLLCFALGHKSCNNVSLISDLSKQFGKSKEFLDTVAASGKHKNLVEQYVGAIQKFRQMNNEYHDKSVKDFMRFRREIDARLDIMEEAVSTEACKFKRENDAKLDHLTETVQSYDKEMESFIRKIEETNNQEEDLFIFVKKHSDQIHQNVNKLEELGDNVNIQKFYFAAEQSVVKSLNKDSYISVETYLTPATTCTSVRQIKVKSCEDQFDCHIVGIVHITETELVCVDYENSCLKLVNTENNTITKRRQVTSRPMDITLLSSCRLGVTLQSCGKIDIFSTDGDLDQCGSIDTDGDCLGIHRTGSQLLVSYCSPVPKIDVLDMTGRVLRTIKPNKSEAALFDVPRYLTYDLNKHQIYVSDWQKNTVTCITIDGEVQWTYHDQNLKHPYGVAAGDGGCVYVCSKATHAIHVLSAGGGKLAVISQDQHGVNFPWALCYSSKRRTMYVSSDGSRSDDRNHITQLSLKGCTMTKPTYPAEL